MIFKFKSKVGKIVELTGERKNHILEFHPDVKRKIYFSQASRKSTPGLDKGFWKCKIENRETNICPVVEFRKPLRG